MASIVSLADMDPDASTSQLPSDGVPNLLQTARRGARIPRAMDVIIRGTDRTGKPFTEKTRTVNVSRTGAKVVVQHSLAHAARLQLAVPHLGRASWGTVAWLAEQNGGPREVGIALDEASDFWGIEFFEETPEKSAKSNEPATLAAGAVTPGEAMGEHAAPLAMEKATPPEANWMRESSEKLSGILQELANLAMEESLAGALRELDQRAADLVRNFQKLVAMQGERLRNSADAALQQREARSLETLEQRLSAWEHRLQSLTDRAEERLETRLEEHERRLEAGAEEVRCKLGRTLVDIGRSLGVS